MRTFEKIICEAPTPNQSWRVCIKSSTQVEGSCEVQFNSRNIYIYIFLTSSSLSGQSLTPFNEEDSINDLRRVDKDTTSTINIKFH